MTDQENVLAEESERTRISGIFFFFFFWGQYSTPKSIDSHREDTLVTSRDQTVVK